MSFKYSDVYSFFLLFFFFFSFLFLFVNHVFKKKEKLGKLYYSLEVHDSDPPFNSRFIKHTTKLFQQVFLFCI